MIMAEALLNIYCVYKVQIPYFPNTVGTHYSASPSLPTSAVLVYGDVYIIRAIGACLINPLTPVSI